MRKTATLTLIVLLCAAELARADDKALPLPAILEPWIR
jgi:hypothetical protein